MRPHKPLCVSWVFAPLSALVGTAIKKIRTNMRTVSVITGVSTDLPPSHPVSSSLIVFPPAFFVASHLSFPLLVFCTWIISLSPLRLSSSPSSSFTPWLYLCSWPVRSYFCLVNRVDLYHCRLTGWSDHGVSTGARHLRGILMM